MKKDASLKNFDWKKQKDLLNHDSSTQITDSSDFASFPPIFETPKKIRANDELRPDMEKLISRTSSVSLLKQPPILIEFEFFCSKIALDVSKK
jgi:hypothetical protein